HPESASVDNLMDLTFSYLTEELERGELRIATGNVSDSSKRLLGMLGRESGVLVCRGDVYEWTHPTFRDYLAASMLADLYRPDMPEWTTMVSNSVAGYDAI